MRRGALALTLLALAPAALAMPANFLLRSGRCGTTMERLPESAPKQRPAPGC